MSGFTRFKALGVLTGLFVTFGAGQVVAQPQVICIKPTPATAAMCGVVSSYTVVPKTFEGWTAVPSGMSDSLFERVGEECTARITGWNETASEGAGNTHIDCFFEEASE